VSTTGAAALIAQLMGRPLVADPFPLYRELRQIDPVHREDNGVWYLTRFGDCERVLRSNEFGHFGLGERLVSEAGGSLSMRLVSGMKEAGTRWSHGRPASQGGVSGRRSMVRPSGTGGVLGKRRSGRPV
jgi:cytochrome P450